MTGPSRRNVLTGAATLGAAAMVLPEDGAAAAVAGAGSEAATPPDLVVETRSGRVRGYRGNGRATFKGIPYGRTPARFEPAYPPAPWPGIRSAWSYGPICPQPVPDAIPSDAARFYAGNPERSAAGEDCLCANIWTPGLAGKRPVLVWIHGGGFESGSAHEGLAYDGESLARRGDLVFVSINHRLGALGFLNLAAHGHARSANVGLLDIVLALEWVRDHIASFGGDPGAVTLMGQSGGGRKVSVLLAMPAAAGLFHRAILHSGSLIGVPVAERTAALAAATLDVLGGIDAARTAAPAILIAAYLAARARFVSPTTTVFDFPYATPTLDGAVIRQQPWVGAAPALSARVPLLIGSTLHEQAEGRARPELVAMTDAELRQRLLVDYGERVDEVIAVFRQACPADPPFATLAAIEAVTPRRNWAIRHAKLKATQGAAPAWLFQFAWRTPILDGAPLAHHGSDLPFALANIDRCVHATGGGGSARALAARMSDAWIAFVRTGDPNHSGLPYWPPVTAGRLSTMLFDDECRVADDHDRAQRRVATVVPESLRHL